MAPDSRTLTDVTQEEQDRLDLQHYLWKAKLDGKLHLAPIQDPRNILDIGTGTGIWAKQLSRVYPNASVVGTDLSLIQPTENLPTNCSFVREDSEEDWVFDKPFDFIHWRLMVSCCEFSLEAWPCALRAVSANIERRS